MSPTSTNFVLRRRATVDHGLGSKPVQTQKQMRNGRENGLVVPTPSALMTLPNLGCVTIGLGP